MEASLKSLASIRQKLDTLRADRSSYIKSSDIDQIFQELAIQLPIIKEHDHTDAVDDKLREEAAAQLDEVFQLLSLFYMTIGRNKEAPSVYAFCTVTRILLNHLTESGVYSNRDLKPVEHKLAEVYSHVERGADKYPPGLIKLLLSRIKECQDVVTTLMKKLSHLMPRSEPVYEQLVSIRRQITAAGARPKLVPAELSELRERLHEIEKSQTQDEDIQGSEESAMKDPLVKGLFDDCNNWANAIENGNMFITPTFQPMFSELADVKGQLEKLSLTQAWSLRETDLFDHLQRLRAVDEARVDGKFIDTQGKHPEESQRLLLYMLRKSYATVYELLNSSEPVSEALQPIYNQLSTLQKCLLEVQKSGGISSQRELFPFSIKLASIDNLRKDGKFYVGSEVPEGQGIINDLLAECFEICHELKDDIDHPSE